MADSIQPIIAADESRLETLMPRSAFAVLLLLVLGCAKEEPIRVYTAPKPVTVEYAILGAMFPADAPAWFFKLTGKREAVEAAAPAFDSFVKSVRFPNGLQNAPVWDLPKDWTEGPAREMRFATLVMPDGLSISVSQAAGGLKGNIDRWAGQVGGDATPTTPITTTSAIAGQRVLLTGPKNPDAAMMGRK
jgi:hypothetical protein